MSESLLENAYLVTDVYGYFPTFHDAEILSLICDRGPKGQGMPVIEFVLHGWEMTSEVLKSGYFRLCKHHVIKFRFEGVDSVELQHFNHQNVLSALNVHEIDQPEDHAQLKVELCSAYGLDGEFRAVRGEVVSVQPCDADGVVLPN